MRLKCIRLAGFKSFVDPTTVSFPSNMTAVVGPNGCGKSNIIDAVRWVLGESSAKNLRGEAMTDVIFNGSNSRQPVAQASIELVFDNSAGQLSGEYASYGEISVRRRVGRDGQNTYFLNGSKCRRRDITDIFLGTGLGPRSYAIIEQGMISRLIEARPDDLRIFIEEAAGISKYKERRRETENRIRRTQENLSRLSDLRQELGRQLERLQRQAGAARSYQQLREQQRQCQQQLTAMRWRELDQQGQQLEQLLDEQEVLLQAQISAQYQADAQSEQLREQQHEQTAGFNQVQAGFYAVGAQIARTEQSIEHGKQRLKQLNHELLQAQRQQQETEQHLAGDRQQLQEQRLQLQELEQRQQQQLEQDELCQAQLLHCEEQLQNWQEQWQQHSQQCARPRQQAELERLRITQLERSGQQLHQSIAALEQELQQLQQQQAGDDSTQLQLEQQRLEQQQQELQYQQQECTARQQQLREAIGQLQQQQHQHQTALQRCQGQIAALQALQEDALQPDESVAGWLQQQQLQNQPRLAQQLQVEPGWEHALETLLQQRLQAVCVESWPDDFSALQGGRLELVRYAPAAEIPLADNSLASKVRHPQLDLSAWLSGVYCADNLDAARQLLARLGAQDTVVTRDGYWLGQNFLRVQLGQEQQQGFLQRAVRLEQLEQQEQQLQLQVQDCQQQLEQQQQQQHGLEQQLATIRSQEQQCAGNLARVSNLLTGQQVRNEQAGQRQQQISAQLQQLQTQQASDGQELEISQQLLQELQLQVAVADEQSAELQQHHASLRQQYEQARARAQDSSRQCQQLEVQSSTLVTRIASTEQALARLQEQLQRGRQRHEQLGLELERDGSPLQELQEQLQAQLEQHQQVEQQLNYARQQLELTDERMRQVEQQRQQAVQQAEQLRSQAEQLRLNRHTLQIQQQALQQELAADELEPAQLLLQLPQQASIEDWQHQLQQLEQQISRLGAINLAAIEEFSRQSQRKEYLDAQNDDLEEALATLENVIRKIDRETRQRFKQTFEQINQGLGELFPKVFGGGMASLALTGEDLLDTGVAIMARPPGKKNSTIHLLSGGEKALTALALVFAIFQLNPAPFCMLDEVDAPLDDANVARYARLVQEMSGHVQFIYITHNKIAMQMADQLLGVTMQEPGCSRMVAVDLEQAAAMAGQ